MSGLFMMDGNGPYVWAAYGITLLVLVWNIWAARASLRRRLKAAARDSGPAEPARRPKVTQL
jgi:heme exporter protein CcmD